MEIASQQLGKTEAKNGSGLHESAGKKSSIPVPNWGKKSLYALSHGSKQLQAVPRSPAHDRDFQYFLTHFQGRFSLEMWKVLIWMWNLELAVIPRYNNQSKVETICILIFLSSSLLQNQLKNLQGAERKLAELQTKYSGMEKQNFELSEKVY